MRGLNNVLDPDWLQVASETNLIRAIAPAALYAAVVATANGVATAVRTADPTANLAVSVQVETAWGGLGGGGTYVGIAQDLADFAFVQGLGLSSYPYFVESDPDSLPLDYYSRLVQGTPRPVFVVEGGWSSVTVTSFPSTPSTQARYIRRHAQLLDDARALFWFQLTFTDLDPAFFPPGANLTPFAYTGLVDDDLVPKLALAEWDAQWGRGRWRRRPEPSAGTLGLPQLHVAAW